MTDDVIHVNPVLLALGGKRGDNYGLHIAIEAVTNLDTIEGQRNLRRRVRQYPYPESETQRFRPERDLRSMIDIDSLSDYDSDQDLISILDRHSGFTDGSESSSQSLSSSSLSSSSILGENVYYVSPKNFRSTGRDGKGRYIEENRLIYPVKFSLQLYTDGRPDGKPVSFIIPYYRSTGNNSSMSGFWFPIYCIQDMNTNNDLHCGVAIFNKSCRWFSKFAGINIKELPRSGDLPYSEGYIYDKALNLSLRKKTTEDPNYMETQKRLLSEGRGELTTSYRILNYFGYLVNHLFFKTQDNLTNPYNEAFFQIHEHVKNSIDIRQPNQISLKVTETITNDEARINEWLDTFNLSRCYKNQIIMYWDYVTGYLKWISRYLVAYHHFKVGLEHSTSDYVSPIKQLEYLHENIKQANHTFDQQKDWTKTDPRCERCVTH